MRSLRPLHSKYISECNAKIDRYTEQVGTQVESVHHLFLLLGASDVTWQSPIVTLSGIKQMIDGIKFEGTKYYYNNDEIDTIVSTCKLDTFLIKSYIKSIIFYISKNKTLNNLISYYKVCSEIPYPLFKSIVSDINFDNQKYILKGGILNLGYGVGKLHIREKKRFIDSNNTKYNQKVIDWNESLKFLLVIAKGQEEAGEHTLYSQYTTHKINKTEFIKLMKSYTYDKNNAPDKPKWLIYHTNEYNYWVTWDKSLNCLPNGQFYSFVPNRVYDEAAPTRLSFISDCKSTEDILNATSYGLQDKVNMLIKFDTTYYLNYKR